LDTTILVGKALNIHTVIPESTNSSSSTQHAAEVDKCYACFNKMIPRSFNNQPTSQDHINIAERTKFME
jgi:hypothetical protein